MIVFPNAKINIGLNILKKREDGFHEIESIFYPTGLCDCLEFVTANKTSLQTTGINIETAHSDNLVIKAYELLKKDYDLPHLSIHLHKVIPLGAGLGGGSSDAVFFLKAVNNYFELNLSLKMLGKYAAQIGSDCTFFLQDSPAYVTGKGEQILPISLNLEGYWLVIIKPEIFISTPEAYRGIKPRVPKTSLLDAINSGIESWREIIENDFENHIFMQHPKLKQIKEKLYKAGAVYASMSGSGSGMFGIFSKKPDITEFESLEFVFREKLILNRFSFCNNKKCIMPVDF